MEDKIDGYFLPPLIHHILLVMLQIAPNETEMNTENRPKLYTHVNIEVYIKNIISVHSNSEMKFSKLFMFLCIHVHLPLYEQCD